MNWPDLPKTGFITARPATDEDIAAGHAVFSLKADETPIGTPYDITIPQYAIHTDSETASQRSCIVIQAEQIKDSEMQPILGVRYADTNADKNADNDDGRGVGTLNEFELLGTEKPNSL